jgi:hypothetical protein
MRQKGERPLSGEAKPPGRVRADLERHGIAPELAQRLADRITAVVSHLPSDQYSAVLSGVAAAYGAPVDEGDGSPQSSGDIAEIQRLLHGFADELGKLEEGLQILSAYVHRMRDRSSDDRDRILH